MPRHLHARLRRTALLLALALLLPAAMSVADAKKDPQSSSETGSTLAGARGPAAPVPALAAAPAVADPRRPAAQQRPQAATPQRRGQRAQERDPEERIAGDGRFDDNAEHGAGGEATLLLTPSRLETRPGRRIHLSLSILGADDLRRLPVTIRFDPEVVAITSVTLGPAWARSSQPVLMHDASRPGELVIGMGQLARSREGITGTAELLELEIVALAPGDAGLVLERFAAIGGGSRTQSTVATKAHIVVR